MATRHPENGDDFEPRSDFERVQQASLVVSGESTPALRLIDDYRQKLDVLTDLLQQQDIASTHASAYGPVFHAALALERLQGNFRRDYFVDALPFERKAIVDIVDETVSVLADTPVVFFGKEHILKNSRDRAVIFRKGIK